MDDQQEADRRLERALEATGALDPRERFRALLRELKSRGEEPYRDAVARWNDEVIAPIARDEGDPLDRWLRFGHTLAQALHPGRTVIVDRSGRARPLEGAPRWSELVLHLPEEKRARAIPVSLPPYPSSAQRATVELLVEGRVKLPEA